MIYQLLKALFRVALGQYFRTVRVYHAEPIPRNKPILFVANHQSALMDALLIAVFVQQPLHFIARGELFDTPIKRWLWSKLNMYPIYRKAFTPGLTHKNKGLIKGYQSLLNGGKSILIFPEGISRTEPRLRDIKTGAARIALGTLAEANDGDEMPLIVPVGINYEDPHQFRSEVTLLFGSPISVANEMAAYQANERAVVRKVTEQIKEALTRLTLDIPDQTLDEVVSTASDIMEEELVEQANNRRRVFGKHFNIRKELINATVFFKANFPFRLQHLSAHLIHYRKMLSNYGIEDQWLRESTKFNNKKWLISTLVRLVCLFPVFALGYLIHLPSLWLANRAVAKWIKRPDFKGSFLLVFGVLFCLVNYGVQILVLAYWSGSFWWTIGYGMFLPVVGMISLKYASWYGQWKRYGKLQQYNQSEDGGILRLKEHRKILRHLLNTAKEDYLKKCKGAISLLW